VTKVFSTSYSHVVSEAEEKMVDTKPKRLSSFPDVVTQLPRAEIAVAGAKAWILQSEACQLVFFEFEADAKVPEHFHTYPQWGMVVDGKMTLVIDGEPLRCAKGTEYLIPAGAKHSATFQGQTRVMDYFSEKSRYKPQDKAGSP
jgi:quercetin dioxygenase-like cupin family protein